jgi:hypothetical protein
MHLPSRSVTRQLSDWTFNFHAHPAQHSARLGRVEFHHATAVQSRWQPDLAKTDTHQPGNGQADRFKHFTNLTIAALAQDDVVPLIHTLATAPFNAVKFSRSIVHDLLYVIE